ncbi:MAG: hypothetical protein K0S55_1496 [Clostridia bacterium]|nr:hypothetical protein [Clostridia bacterium]
MKVKDLMSQNVVKVNADDSIQKVAELMKDNNIGIVPVERDGKLTGIITDRDITLRCVAQGNDPSLVKTEYVMTTNPLISISPEHSVIEAARIMAREQVRRLPVCDNGKVIGMLSLGDLARAKRMFAETASAFCDICDTRKDEE